MDVNLDLHPRSLFVVQDSSKTIQDSMKDLIQRSQVHIRGHLVNTPDGSRNYKGCWVRDFTLLCEIGPPLITAKTMKEGLDLFFENQGPKGEIPDWVPWESGAKVSYALFGKYRFLDNPLWLVRLMILYLEESRDFDYFKLRESALIKGLYSENLVDADDLVLKIDENNIRDDWGFTDCIKKTGVVLFSNLLKIDAMKGLSAIYKRLGDDQKSEIYLKPIDAIINGLEVLWDPVQHLYYSASKNGHRIDVWGNAFAVYANLLPPERLETMSTALFENQSRFLWQGQVRHLFLKEFWDRFHDGVPFLAKRKNEYQNGAYWGTPSGWMSVALEKAQNGAGQRLIDDLLAFYTRVGIFECVFPKHGHKMSQKCHHYVASLSLPYRMLKIQQQF